MKRLITICTVMTMILALSGVAQADMAPIRVSMGSGSFPVASVGDSETPEWVVATSAGYPQTYIWPPQQVEYPVGYTYYVEVLGFTPLPQIADSHDWSDLPDYHSVKIGVTDDNYNAVKAFAYPDNQSSDPKDLLGIRYDGDSNLGLDTHVNDLGDKFDLRMEFYQTVADGAITVTSYYRRDAETFWTQWATGTTPDTYALSNDGAPFMIVGGGAGTASWDDYAYTTVPVPGAVLLGIFGLSAVGIKLRKHA